MHDIRSAWISVGWMGEAHDVGPVLDVQTSAEYLRTVLGQLP